MHRRALIVLTLVVPSVLAGQSPPTPELPNAVMLQFIRFADIFGSRLVAAFDSIPAARYHYRPTPSQQTIGYIAQHLEDANYSLCERLGVLKHPRTQKDSLSDTVKAQWPKDTLVERLEASRSEEHTSELQSRLHLVCRLLLEKKKNTKRHHTT